MKQLLLSISVICFTNCFAQEPNPDLFQTWYLYSVMASDGTPAPYVVSEIEPTITPTLTILEDLTFYGTGACNTFNGTFNLPYPDNLETDQFSNTTDDCGIESHNNFENEYFDFIQLIGSGYYLSTEDNGMELKLNTPVFGQAVFKNFPLNITKFELHQIDIYPNPISSLIHLKSQNSHIIKIELFNSIGQTIKTIENNFDTIDLSDLSNGFYIMKIDSKFGTINKRIIKK
ncbi:T9SS type A sorting domain-containing protein [Bizionia arctica]|uniref:T9SS type A sorting domain-containing protein n=1 Tax=Bizionia arctica TaxID=1495645 RepID=A0A917GG14_9FLAO|nr:T9SS type A sorting domain-containing protein [Bizionia arctica]GGG44158.1 hypothetical protein GCM10010976_14680 [Bizionia arctica]